MILVMSKNQGLICFLSSYYNYEVNNNLIIFNKNDITSNTIIKFDNYDDFQSAIDCIDIELKKLKL